MKIYVKITDDNNQTFEGIAELKKTPKTKSNIKAIASLASPADLIKIFYFENFFETARTVSDVENKIKSKKYNFEYDAIRMALARSKFLKHQGKRGSYSYIQITPPK